MQLQFRIDDANYLVVDVKFEETSFTGRQGDAEIAAAVVSDHKLSDLEMDQFTDLVGQVLDHLQGRSERPQPRAQDDWREKFRRGEL